MSEADRVALEAECIREHGVDAETQGIALIVDEGFGEQAAAAEQIVALCMEQVESVFPRTTGRDYSSIESRKELYDLQVATWNCLRDEGYEVEGPPSLDTWLESWDLGPWDPYLLVTGQIGTESEWTTINELCPQPADTVFRMWDPIVVDP